MLRLSGNILDIAKAICNRSNRVLGFVNQHRVHLLMKALCRTANSRKPGLVIGALRIACNGLCTAARFHKAEDNLGCRLGCLEELDCLRHYNCCHILSDHLNSPWQGTKEYISPTAIFNDLLFKIAVRSDRLCILVAGLLDAFVTAFNLRRTYWGPGLNFKEFTCGKTKMMTALCPAWAHTYQTMCLGFNLEQLEHEAFRLPKTKKQFSMLPTCRISIRMTGIESPSWRLFIDGGFKRQAGGTDAAGWGTAAAST